MRQIRSVCYTAAKSSKIQLVYGRYMAEEVKEDKPVNAMSSNVEALGQQMAEA